MEFELSTVANCLHNKDTKFATRASDLMLLFGAFDLDNAYETGRKIEGVSEIIIHPGWDSTAKRFNDDIALLILEDEIAFTKYIRPVCLMTEDRGVDDGIVVGWGRSEDTTKYHESIPKALQIPIVSNQECFVQNSRTVDLAWPKSFCAGRPGVGVCIGDSGAGFFVKFQGKFYLRGVVSSGAFSEKFIATGCFTDNFVLYADVSKYSDFIGV